MVNLTTDKIKEEGLPLPVIEKILKDIDKEKKDSDLTISSKSYNGKVVVASLLGHNEGRGMGLLKNSKTVMIMGCAKCGWCETPKCPHYGEVNRRRHHSNGFCTQRLELANALIEDGVIMTPNRLIMIKHFMELEEIDMGIQKKIADGEIDAMAILPFKKLLLDTIKDLIKHEEGSKLTVKKDVSPLDVADILRKNREKTVNAKVSNKNE